MDGTLRQRETLVCEPRRRNGLLFWTRMIFGKQTRSRPNGKQASFSPNAAIISCDVFTLHDGQISHRSNGELRKRLENVPNSAITSNEITHFPEVNGAVLIWFTISPTSALISREVFDTAGFFDQTLLYSTEVEFFARALKVHSLAFIQQLLVCQRIRKDSHSSNVEGKWTSYVSIVDRMLRYPD